SASATSPCPSSFGPTTNIEPGPKNRGQVKYPQGVHQVRLDGLMTNIYLCRMRAEGFEDTARFTVVR
ncbi:hypothetical protein JW921_01510, partial [Candidatus Fermentibacterales bacterium]|nr:hypothetical protein [Candidatus Fermentibacterales bacterium]